MKLSNIVSSSLLALPAVPTVARASANPQALEHYNQTWTSQSKKALLALTSVCASFLIASANARVPIAADGILHLSPCGDDKNAATEESPLKSLAAAFKIVASQPNQKHTLVLAPGSYALHETLRLTKAHSNTLIRATAPGVAVHGGRLVSPEAHSQGHRLHDP